jgi:hypothetical protein
MDETLISNLISTVLVIITAVVSLKLKQSTTEVTTANAQVVEIQNTAGSVLSLVDSITKLISDYKEKETDGITDEEKECLFKDIDIIAHNSAVADLKKLLP